MRYTCIMLDNPISDRLRDTVDQTAEKIKESLNKGFFVRTDVNYEQKNNAQNDISSWASAPGTLLIVGFEKEADDKIKIVNFSTSGRDPSVKIGFSNLRKSYDLDSPISVTLEGNQLTFLHNAEKKMEELEKFRKIIDRESEGQKVSQEQIDNLKREPVSRFDTLQGRLDNFRKDIASSKPSSSSSSAGIAGGLSIKLSKTIVEPKQKSSEVSQLQEEQPGAAPQPSQSQEQAPVLDEQKSPRMK